MAQRQRSGLIICWSQVRILLGPPLLSASTRQKTAGCMVILLSGVGCLTPTLTPSPRALVGDVGPFAIVEDESIFLRRSPEDPGGR